MKKLVFVLTLCLFAQSIFAQKYDYRWILGYIGNPDLTGITDVVFSDTGVDTINSHRNVTMQNSQTTISDSGGNLLFFSNGCRIFNHVNDTMQNGDSINYGDAWSQYYSGVSYNAPEDILGLPTDTPGVWNLIHYYLEYNPFSAPYLWPWRIEESKVDMRQDSGLGAVVFKNKILLQDTIVGYVTACQHANGRDWWVLASKSSSNCLYTLLVQPDTVIQYPLQCIGNSYTSEDAGQAAFSPDGTKFALVGEYSGIYIYDFDRCTGQLSNPIHLPFYGDYETNIEYGLGFSPSSRFLYVTQQIYILQFDMLSNDLAASVDTVGYYTAAPDTNSAPEYFFLMQLAPDGKIYVSASNGIKYLHVINQPDKKGDSCNFVNYGLRLPNYNSFGLPSYPSNYRLGPLHGSLCDTLTKTDTTGVGLTTINKEKILKIYPNPSTDYAIVDYGFTDWSMGIVVSMEITNAIGQVIYTQSLPAYSGFLRLDISRFAAGIYDVAIKRSGATVTMAKLVKE